MGTRVVALVSRIGRAWTRRRNDGDARHELQQHLALLTEHYVGQAMTPEAAERAARREFGNAALVREDVRARNGFRWIDRVLQDLRFATRRILRNE